MGRCWAGRSATYLHWTEVAWMDEGVSEPNHSPCHLTRDADNHPARDTSFPSQHWVQSPSGDDWGRAAGKSRWTYWKDPLSFASRYPHPGASAIWHMPGTALLGSRSDFSLLSGLTWSVPSSVSEPSEGVTLEQAAVASCALGVPEKPKNQHLHPLKAKLEGQRGHYLWLSSIICFTFMLWVHPV